MPEGKSEPIKERLESDPNYRCYNGHGLYDRVDSSGNKTCPECRPKEEIPVIEGAVVRLRGDYFSKKQK